MVQAIIIDDEPHALQVLRELIAEHFRQVTVIGEATNMKDGERLIRATDPDLVLLDIELGDGDAFELLSRFRDVSFRVIFVTAYNEYAVKAFKFSAVDYVLKPIDPEDLKKAINKALTYQKSDFSTRLDAFINNFSQDIKKIVLNSADTVYVIAISDIIRCESEINYTHVYTGQEKITVAKTLKEFDLLLSAYGFFRTHQSHLINLRFLTSYHKKNREVILSDTSRVPVSTRNLEGLIAALKT